MKHGGITLSLDGGDVKLFAELGSVLLDGGAHKYVWGARGDSASKFCLLCKNLFSGESHVVDEDGSNLLRCDVIKRSELEPASDADLRRNMRFLEQESSRIGPDAFTQLQQALGLTYHPRGVLVDRELDSLLQPTSTYSHDWMHALFVDGVVNLTLYLTFEACIKGPAQMVGVYESFSAYLSQWRFPARLHATHLDAIFSADRRDSHRTAKHIKCQASDLLTTMDPLKLFIANVLQTQDIAPRACTSLLCLCDLVELIVATARLTVTPDMLAAEVHRFLKAFVDAFGFEWLTPKAHWLLHLPDHLARFGRLLNCFALERKHRIPKRYATDLKNIAHKADASLLKECICHHFSSVKDGAFEYTVALIDKRSASAQTRRTIWKLFELEDDASAINVATIARYNPTALCSQSDVVMIKDGDGFRGGRIQVHFELHGVLMSLVKPYNLYRRDSNSALAVWDVIDGPIECWEVTDILAAVPYSFFPDGRVGTILPIELR